MAPDAVVNLVKDSELRGRGGAGFPCGLKWTFLPKDRKETLMCVNADESEPATFNNRHLMENDPAPVDRGDPDRLLRHPGEHGLRLPAVRVHHAPTAFSNGPSPRPVRRGTWEEHLRHRLRPRRLGPPRRGAYICGEETGLIESLEGKRGWPRIKPPFPAIEGAFRKPTVVNNVETLCCVPHIVQRGTAWFKSIGTAQELRTEALHDLGPCQPPGLCRAASGHHLPGLDRGPRRRRLERTQGQGGRARRHQHGAAFSRRAGHPARLREPAQARLPWAGNGRGHRARRSDADHRLPLQHLPVLRPRSCGQCTPCREGTGWLYKMVKRIRSGEGRLEDLDVMLNMANNMGIIPGTTICGLADGAAWPIKNAMGKFRGELEDHIRTHQIAGCEVSRFRKTSPMAGVPARPAAGCPFSRPAAGIGKLAPWPG